MIRKVKKYFEIQLRLRMNGFTKKDVAEHIGRSEDYAARRFRLDAGRGFGLEEAYKILDLAGLPKSDIFKYFPPGGEAPAEPLNGPRLMERKEAII